MASADGNETAPVADSPARFAAELRRLWVEAGEPSFMALERATSRSKTSLNNATLTSQPLASAEVVRALVQELAPSRVEEFCARRDQIAGKSSPAKNDADLRPQRLLTSLRRPVQVVTVACAIGGAFMFGRLTAPSSEPSDGGRVAPRSANLDGTDVANTICVQDAETVARREVAGVGVLELLHSARCDTYWARATRGDEGFGRRIQVTVLNLRDRHQEQTATERDVSSAYSFQVVRQRPEDRMCATGLIGTTNGDKSFGTPLC